MMIKAHREGGRKIFEYLLHYGFVKNQDEFEIMVSCAIDDPGAGSSSEFDFRSPTGPVIEEKAQLSKR